MLAEKCQHCGQEKFALSEKTTRKGLTVFVCSEPKKPNKSPCDGGAFALATNG